MIARRLLKKFWQSQGAGGQKFISPRPPFLFARLLSREAGLRVGSVSAILR